MSDAALLFPWLSGARVTRRVIVSASLVASILIDFNSGRFPIPPKKVIAVIPMFGT